MIIIYTRAIEETTVVRWKVLREHSFTLTVFRLYLSDWLSDWISEWVFVSALMLSVCTYGRTVCIVECRCFVLRQRPILKSILPAITTLIWAFDFTSSLFFLLFLLFFFCLINLSCHDKKKRSAVASSNVFHGLKRSNMWEIPNFCGDEIVFTLCIDFLFFFAIDPFLAIHMSISFNSFPFLPLQI